jgi:hypothetical protein
MGEVQQNQAELPAAATTAVRSLQSDEIPGSFVNPSLKRLVREIRRQASERRGSSSWGAPYSTPGRVTARVDPTQLPRPLRTHIGKPAGIGCIALAAANELDLSPVA